MAQPMPFKPAFSIFDEQLTALIIKVLRKGRVAKKDLEDVFQVLQIEVKNCKTLPAIEPDRTRYILGIASNHAARYRGKKAEDLETVSLDAVRAVAAPMRAGSLEARDLLEKHYLPAAAKEPETADIFERTALDDEKQTAIAAQEDVPVDRLRKRQQRFLDRVRDAIVESLKERSGPIALVLMMIMCGAAMLAKTRAPETAQSPEASQLDEHRKQQRVQALRDQAAAACADGFWDRCRSYLDLAAADDPNGELSPRVQQLRQTIERGLNPPPPETPDNPLVGPNDGKKLPGEPK